MRVLCRILHFLSHHKDERVGHVCVFCRVCMHITCGCMCRSNYIYITNYVLFSSFQIGGKYSA
jgi:hypothetical protein